MNLRVYNALRKVASRDIEDSFKAALIAADAKKKLVPRLGSYGISMLKDGLDNYDVKAAASDIARLALEQQLPKGRYGFLHSKDIIDYEPWAMITEDGTLIPHPLIQYKLGTIEDSPTRNAAVQWLVQGSDALSHLNIDTKDTKGLSLADVARVASIKII